MAIDPSRSDAPQELRLEGFRLVASVLVLGALVLAAVVGAFLLGRWVEGRSHPGPQVAGDRGGPLAQVVAPGEPLEAEEGLTYFDRVGEGERAEPGREVGALPARDEPPVESGDSALAHPDDAGEVAPAEPEGGPYFVQVFAGRDRDSAEQLVGRLQTSGFRVHVVSEREGRDELFKVRVGGYPSDTSAREASQALRSKGFTGAWVIRED